MTDEALDYMLSMTDKMQAFALKEIDAAHEQRMGKIPVLDEEVRFRELDRHHEERMAAIHEYHRTRMEAIDRSYAKTSRRTNLKAAAAGALLFLLIAAPLVYAGYRSDEMKKRPCEAFADEPLREVPLRCVRIREENRVVESQ